VSRAKVKGDGEKGDNSRQKEVQDEEVEKKKTEAHTSTPPNKRNQSQEGEISKNMKYHKNPPILTITKDDADFIAEKVQDRGENALLATESQREDVMENIE
jgi:hypothetical protein